MPLSWYKYVRAEAEKITFGRYLLSLLLVVLYGLYFGGLIFFTANEHLVKALEVNQGNLGVWLFLQDWGSLALVVLAFLIPSCILQDEVDSGDYISIKRIGLSLRATYLASLFHSIVVYFMTMIAFVATYLIVFFLYTYKSGTDIYLYINPDVVLIHFVHAISGVAALIAGFAVALWLKDVFRTMVLSVFICVFALTLNYLDMGMTTPFTITGTLFDIQNSIAPYQSPFLLILNLDMLLSVILAVLLVTLAIFSVSRKDEELRVNHNRRIIPCKQL